MLKYKTKSSISFLTFEICNEYLVKPLARATSHSLTRGTIKLLNTEIYNWWYQLVHRYKTTHITEYSKTNIYSPALLSPGQPVLL